MGVLLNASTGNVIATRVEIASTFVQRAFGLLAREVVRRDEGLWLRRCSAIHTLGMRVPIDIIFVDASDRVVRLCPDVKQWRPAIVCLQAASVIELGNGALREIDVMPGDRLKLT